MRALDTTARGLRRLVAAVTVLALPLAGCTDVTFEPVGAVSAGLSTTSDDVRIGVIVSTQGPGASALGPAHGAVVAAARFNDLQDSGPVELVVADDLGNAQGAAQAVDDLVAAGVAGIVVASVGPQVAAAAASADAAGVPLLAPLATDPAAVEGATTAWLTGPTDDQLAAVVSGLEVEGPLLVLAPTSATVPAALGSAIQVEVSGALLGEQVGEQVAATDPSVVVWWGAPEDGLGVISALQRADRQLPVTLQHAALLPGFGRALAAAVEDGNLVASTPLYAPGAMPPQDASIENRSFRAARDLVATRGLPGLAGAATDDPAADLAAADARVHDAVLDLVAAVDAAGSGAPDAVVEALRTGDVVAGRVTVRPDYAAGQTPFPDDLVVLLQAAGLERVEALPAPAAGPLLRWAPTTALGSSATPGDAATVDG